MLTLRLITWLHDGYSRGRLSSAMTKDMLALARVRREMMVMSWTGIEYLGLNLYSLGILGLNWLESLTPPIPSILTQVHCPFDFRSGCKFSACQNPWPSMQSIGISLNLPIMWVYCSGLVVDYMQEILLNFDVYIYNWLEFI